MLVYCTRCGAKMIEGQTTGTEILSKWAIYCDDYVAVGKTYRKDNGEEIKVKEWYCPNKGKLNNYNWFQINILGYPKLELHDTKYVYINQDNPNAVIL